MTANDPCKLLTVGYIAGAYGVRGWVKVVSDTEPRENILRYSPWYVGPEHRAIPVQTGRVHGKGVIAKLLGHDTRDHAQALAGAEIAVRRDQLDPIPPGEFYWADLIGLTVTTEEGQTLGQVTRLMATGANDVLVVVGERERLVPFIDDVVLLVDLENGRMVVSWDPDL